MRAIPYAASWSDCSRSAQKARLATHSLSLLSFVSSSSSSCAAAPNAHTIFCFFLLDLEADVA
jgi:hypothetical protein